MPPISGADGALQVSIDGVNWATLADDRERPKARAKRKASEARAKAFAPYAFAALLRGTAKRAALLKNR